MKKIFILNILVLLAFQASAQEEPLNVWINTFLNAHVSPTTGLVDYKGILNNPRGLGEIVHAIGETSIPALSAEEEKAFYINAYNILVIKQVLDHYPIGGPLEVQGFFDGIQHKVAGRLLTLDQLEKETLYKKFPDARLHFAVVCAAKGCPRLANFAYKGSRLEVQLDVRTKAVLNDPQFTRYAPGKVLISQIFEWYSGDFVPDALSYMNKYLKEPAPSSAKVEFYEYDWSLNEQ